MGVGLQAHQEGGVVLQRKHKWSLDRKAKEMKVIMQHSARVTLPIENQNTFIFCPMWIFRKLLLLDIQEAAASVDQILA